MRNKSRDMIKKDLARLKTDLALSAKEMRGHARGALNESLENMRERTNELQGNVAEYVGEKPFKSLGIAMLSGFILAVAMRRKKLHRRNSHV